MAPALAPPQVVTDRRPGALRDAGSAATGYRPTLLTWVAGEPTATLVERMRRTAAGWDPRSRLVPLDEATQLLLLPEAERPSRERQREAVRRVVAVARSAWPDVRIRVVMGDRVAPGESLAIAAARLRRVARRTLASPSDEPVSARSHSFSSLLESLDQREAAAFVEEQLAALQAYDHEHGTGLQRVLELALDHHDRSTAASAAFMHRNTFRRQLARALDLVGADLADPWERLALHLALKLRSRAAPSARRR